MDFGFFNWMDKLGRYYPFNRKELLWLGVSVFALTFIVGFNDGHAEFIASRFFGNLLISFIAVIIAVFIHESAHRIVAPNLGYRLEFKPFFFGILGGIILAFMTYGHVIFLAHGSFYLDIMQKHRLGYFRHYLGYFDNGKVAIAGPLANLAAAMVFKMLTFIPEALLSKIIFVNVLFAITNMLPIPPLDGAHVMYATKTVYPFLMAAIIGAAALLLLPGVSLWMVLAGAFAIAVAFTFIYVTILEGKVFGKW